MIPYSLNANPNLARWVAFEPDGKVRIAFGKVEYGQGNMTALAQIGAEELDVSFERIRTEEPATDKAPDEGLTVGSMSIEMSGAAVRAACAEVRAIFLAKLAEEIGCSAEELAVRDGTFLRDGRPAGESYWSLAHRVDLKRPPSDGVPTKSHTAYTIVGKSQPRRDLPPKLFGAAFIHDFLPEGVIHARVLRQPGSRAKLDALDETAIRRAAQGEEIGRASCRERV